MAYYFELNNYIFLEI